MVARPQGRLAQRTRREATTRRGVVTGVVALAAVVGLAWSGSSAAEADELELTDRLDGEGRFETAVAISQEAFPEQADQVYLARSDEFADALAAAALDDGPILLVPSDGEVPPVVAEEIDRLDPDTVVALGGERAVSDGVLAEAADARATDRLAGATRFDTAVEIATAAFPDGAERAYLARADGFADALAAGALDDGPILLVPSDGAVPEQVIDAVDALGVDEVVALGGRSAISDQVLEDAAGEVDTDRLAGPGRIETAVEIARAAFPGTADRVYLTRQDDFPDALAAGALTDGPILLIPSCDDLPAVVGDAIEDLEPIQVVALGGPAAVCDDILEDGGEFVAAPVTYLADMDPLDSERGTTIGGQGWGTASRRVNTLDYARSLFLDTSRTDTGWKEYQVDFAFEQLRATVGIADDGDVDARAQFDVVADSETVASEQVGFAETEELVADIDDARRVTVEVTKLNGDADRSDYVLGNARFLRDADRPLDDAFIDEPDLPSRVRLDDEDPVEEERGTTIGGQGWDTGSRTVDTQDFARTLTLDTSRTDTGWREYQAQRAYDTLTGTVGIADDGDADARGQFEIVADGETVAREQASFGETVDIEGDVSGAMRVRIEITKLNGDADRSDYVFAEPEMRAED